MTFEGKWFLLLTFGVGAAAINTGNNLLYLALSMNLSLVILSGVLSEWSLRGVGVSVRHASEAFASRDSFLAVACSASGKRFPAMSLAVSLTIEGERHGVRFPDIPAGKTATRVIPFRPGRRGLILPSRCTVSTLFPFGLFEKSADVDAGAPLLVYPDPAGGTAPFSLPDPGGDAGGTLDARLQGPLVKGAREHRPADPFRDIHWKASARLGKWMVKEREGESAPAAELRLPAESPPDEFERAVSGACALVLRWEREGRPYRIRLGGVPCVEPSDAGRRAKALAFLATVRP